MSISNYAKRMGILSARVFGEVARPTNKKSMKVVNMYAAQPHSKNEFVAEYYPRHNQLYWIMKRIRYLGLFRDEHLDIRDENRRKKALRGKGKPAKGEGKRAQKKK